MSGSVRPGMHSGRAGPTYLMSKKVNGRNGSIPEADEGHAVNGESLQITEETETEKEMW